MPGSGGIPTANRRRSAIGLPRAEWPPEIRRFEAFTNRNRLLTEARSETHEKGAP